MKNYQLHGNLCCKSHKRLAHSAKNCKYGLCNSVFCCDELKFHEGEVNTKDSTSTFAKKATRVLLLKSELEYRKAAHKSIRELLARWIEANLFQVSSDEYMFYSQKNWSLLRRHVHAVEQYCKSDYNGKFPAKKDHKFVLKRLLKAPVYLQTLTLYALGNDMRTPLEVFLKHAELNSFSVSRMLIIIMQLFLGYDIMRTLYTNQEEEEDAVIFS